MPTDVSNMAQILIMKIWRPGAGEDKIKSRSLRA